jgi:YHS domain-containing protein
MSVWLQQQSQTQRKPLAPALATVASAAIMFLALVAPARAAGERSAPVNQSSEGVAIEGYDPVAYFTDSKPVKGSPQYTYQWHGAVWHFASAQHRDAFAKFPDSYAPQYGGYCAYGVSQGHTAPVDPAAWKIINGKLYLNYNREVQELFLKDPSSGIEKADQNWPKLHK